MKKSDFTDAVLIDDKREKAARRHTDVLSANWRKAHEARTAEIEARLLKERTDADADEKLLLQLAAHDAALCQTLGQSELQLAQRVLALIDNAAVGLQLARTLKQVAASRDLATRRLEGLLEAAGVLRGQRKLARVSPLRRVA